MSISLASGTWTEIPDRPIVLVPIGSTEQHGPHLPFTTDTLIAEQVARAVAQELESTQAGSVVVAPSLSYGASGEHQDFPGTISIGHEALRVVLIELIRSVSTWAGRIVLINGHGGNTSTVQQVIEQMQYEQHNVMWTPCALESATDAHAGHDETSVLLHLAPELVRMDAAVPGNTRPLSELLPELMASGVRPVAPSGVLGDPKRADAEVGEREFRGLVARIVREIRSA